MANAINPTAPVDQSNINGKTSGWYHGANYDTVNMWKACMNRDNDTLKRCLKAGLNVNHCRWVKSDNIVGTGARSVADVVACKNDVRAMRLLIEHGADLSGIVTATYASSTSVKRDFLFTGDDRKLVQKKPWTTPLHIACRYGYVELLRVILDEGRVDANTRDSQNQAGLHLSVITTGAFQVAKLLLERGAVVNVKDNLGITPLAAAALSGKLELVDLLLNNGAATDTADNRGETALYNASLRGHTSVIAALASRGANLDLRNIHGMSAFLTAASALKTDTMAALTECGGDTDTRDNSGCTALVRATMAKNIPLIIQLLQLGADIDAEDSDGWTPLFAAMIHNDESLYRYLLPYGCTMGKTDIYGNTTLHLAAILGATLVVRHILASHTYDHSQMNIFGETSLALASKHNNSPIVKVLLKHGANPHHIDPNGYRAIDRAMYWGSYACFRLLLKAGVGIDSRALLALQQGRHDNLDDAGKHDTILNPLRSQDPTLILPLATSSSQLGDLFARSMTRNTLRARMLKKQGKSDLIPSTDQTKDEEVISPDPFEACIPKALPIHIDNSTTNIIKTNGNGTSVLEIGAVGGTNLALGITNTVLGL